MAAYYVRVLLRIYGYNQRLVMRVVRSVQHCWDGISTVIMNVMRMVFATASMDRILGRPLVMRQ